MRLFIFIFIALYSFSANAFETTNAAFDKKNASILNRDAQVVIVYALGKNPQLTTAVNLIHRDVVSAIVTNNGTDSLIDLEVTLAVTGVNTFNTSKRVTISPGDSTLIAFDVFLPLYMGINNIVVAVPADDDNSNNTASWRQEVNFNTFSYADTSAVAGSFGFGLGSGLILVKYSMANLARIRKVIVQISDDPANVGNAVYAVVLRADGFVLAQSATIILTQSDLNTKKEFLLPTHSLITAGSFFVGLAQTPGATSYFPVSYQDELPSRPTGFWTGLIGGGPLGTGVVINRTNRRFMIDAEINVDLVPVKLQSFTAAKTASAVELRWATVEEFNVNKFVVERSRDGISFLPIGEVNAKGTQVTPSRYQFSDQQPLSGINYYRLRIVDLDNRFEYSPVVHIENQAGSRLSVYPNPVGDMMYVTIHSGRVQPAICEVFDMNGKRLYKKPLTLVVGQNALQIPTNSLPKGSYSLKMSLGADLMVNPFQKL